MAKNRRHYVATLPKRFQKITTLFRESWSIVFAVLACAGVAVGIFVIKPAIIKWRVEQDTQFRKGTDTYKKLVNITVPIFFNVRVFNITNPDAIEKGEKFNLEELGPYVYEEKRVKNVTHENYEEGTITFFETKTYFFRPDLSNGSESDLVNTINFPFLTASIISKRYILGLSNYITDMLEAFGETIIQRDVAVGHLIFNGFELDPTYNVLNELNPRGYHKQFSDGKFAYFNRENASDTGEFKMFSGVKGSSNFGNIASWNGESELNFWTNTSLPPDQQYCNRFNGSDGSLNPPFLTKNRTIHFFYTSLCRSIPMKYNKEISFEGVPGWQFTIPQNVLDAPDKNPDSQCFCHNPGGGLKKDCVDGMYRAFACYKDAPLVLSKPHFLDGDPQLIEGVTGLHPSRKNHDSLYEIEPISGMFLRASIKFQLVAELQPLDGVSALEDLPHVFLPIMWIEQLSYLDEEHLTFIKWQLVIPLTLAKWLEWFSIACCVVLLVCAICYTAKRNSKNLEVRNVEMEPISAISNYD